jgi:hypothetical protein
MNATETEVPEQAFNVEEQARIVLSLLREYAEKLAVLGNELLALISRYTSNFHGPHNNQAAWLLDQSELIRSPLQNILSRATGLHENSAISRLTEDELALRRSEIEVHLHHVIRQTGELRVIVDRSKTTASDIAKLRLSAGLNAMKGGPLRPD